MYVKKLQQEERYQIFVWNKAENKLGFSICTTLAALASVAPHWDVTTLPPGRALQDRKIYAQLALFDCGF